MVNAITPQEADQWLSAGDAILIDVREPDEFRSEHIVYANSLPLGNLEDLFKQMNIPASRKIIFQCLKGARGGQACVRIDACGACENEIYNLEGGITAWKDAGLAVVAGPSGLSIFRQVQIIVGALIFLFVALGFMGLSFGFVLAGIFGGLLCFAGLTGWCGLAMVLRKMPWNK